MGFLRTLKSLVDSEVLGEEIIFANQRVYEQQKVLSPACSAHELLALTYISRKRALRQEVAVETAFARTIIFSNLPNGQGIRACALYLLYEEKPDIIAKHDKFEQEYYKIMGQSLYTL